MSRRSFLAGWMVFLTVFAVGVRAADDEQAAEPALRFLRVHVPHGKLAEIDLGRDRYVPMSAAEFTAGVARLLGNDRGPAGAAGFGVVAETCRYEAALHGDGREGGTGGQPQLVGTASWTIRETGPGRSLPVGGLMVERAWMRTSAGTGDAVVFGRPDGSLYIRAPEPGEYACDWRCGPIDVVDDAVVFRLPLPAALSTTLELRLPSAVMPVIDGADMLTRDPAAEGLWRIDIGPRRFIDIAIVPTPPTQEPRFPRARVWHAALVRGREVRLTAVVAPVAAWQPPANAGVRRVSLAIPPDLVVSRVELRAPGDGPSSAVEWTRPGGGGDLEIVVPARAIGSRDLVVVDGVAPWGHGRMSAVPLVRVPRSSWAGGGVTLEVDAALAVSRLEVEGCAVVPPTVSSRWPVAAAADQQPGMKPSRMDVEVQQAEHAVSLVTEPRIASADVSRLTVVDVSPGAVLGRTTCDVSVGRGEAFEIRGRLAKGWVLDAVEAVSGAETGGEGVDWKVVRSGGEDEVRIGLATAVSPGRGLTLRLTGHRAGVPPGGDVTSGELDMVRFVGEDRAAVLAVKTGPEMTVDLVGDEPPLVGTDTLLAALAADTAIRVRLPAGARAADRVMRLERRRPPLDARTDVRLTSRDGRLTHSFTFECTPQRTDIDALVIHFSAPMDDRLEWSLLPPAAGSLVARRVAPPDRRDSRGGEPAADSWSVEFSPPVRGTVTIRATSTVPFADPMPVPLAWVEGATRRTGIVSVREAGRFRPRIVNRRLEELPPSTDEGDATLATVAEFSFDPDRGRPDDGLPAATILPGGEGSGDDARAWAWTGETTLWCNASGTVEIETLFTLENHGRAAVTLSAPAGVQVQGVLVDGAAVGGDAASGEMTVELPVGHRFVTLLVRGVARHDARPGLWWVDPQGMSLDLPVLRRSHRVLLAPDVAIARAAGGYRVVAERVGAGTAAVPLTPSGSLVEGYRERTIVPVVGRRAGGLLLVRTAVVQAATIITACAVFLCMLFVPAARGWPLPVLCAVAAVGALWVAVPFDAVFRAACWAAVVAGALRLGGGAARSAGTAALLLTCLVDAAGAAEPLRVYFTPIDAAASGEETALVPEPLFRALARATTEPAAVRVVAATVVARPPTAGPAAAADVWQITIDVDADAGTRLDIDQAAANASVVGDRAVVDGVPQAMQVEAAGSRATIPLPSAGRHRVEVSVRPGFVRRGDVDEATVVLPCAASGRLVLAAAVETAALVCEVAAPGGVFLPASRIAAGAAAQPAFDISRAAAVRVSRANDPRVRLARVVKTAVSRNDVFWDPDACRVIATFDIDGGSEVVRSVIVRADAELVPVDGAAGVRAISRHRFLVERPTPTRGRWTVQVPFRMPLEAPVGVFRVPGAWLENVADDARTTLFVPAPDLSVDVKLPDGMSAAPREADASLLGFAWRADVARPLAGGDAGGDRFPLAAAPPAERPVATVERRAARPRAAQRLAVEFEAEQVRLGLLARIDAPATALVDLEVDVPPEAIIDRLNLVDDGPPQADSADVAPVDVRWSRIAPGRLLVVVQRPRSGRFRLEVEARLRSRPAARASLPLMRAALANAVPMVVEWSVAAGSDAAVVATFGTPAGGGRAVAPGAERSASGTLELLGGETALLYEIGSSETVEPPPAAVDASATASGRSVRDARVEWAEIAWETDGRGRVWGRVVFEAVVAESSVRLSLPPGTRLFEVLVDGRSVAAVPQEDGTWLVPMFGSRWPRSIQAVFAGDRGAAIDGTPFEVVPPILVGLPCRAVAWTCRASPGLEVRVAGPARAISADALAVARRGVAERLEDEFINAIEKMGAADRSRMTSYARLRRAGAWLPSEDAWTRSMEADHPSENAVHVLVQEPAGDGRGAALVLRIDRSAEPTAPLRALATLGVIVTCAGAWHLAARWPARRHAAETPPADAIALAREITVAQFSPSAPDSQGDVAPIRDGSASHR